MTARDPQALRRRHRRERQAVVFGSMLAAMAVAALGATAVYTGVIDPPFAREFTTLRPEAEGAGAAPCPPEGAVPTTYGEVQVQVLNGAGRAGLAADVGDQLAARGFTVLSADNFPGDYPGIALVRFGETGLRAGYTLAAQIDGAALLIDTRTEPTVDLVLGGAYSTLVEPAAVPLAPGEPLVGVEGCVPLDEALQVAPPGPAPATEEPAEGEQAPAEGEQAPAEG
ncbi:LytR C-terminal domain-containing protein [Cellulomonas carbonis]|uniref:LytR/CpsA/Psr regulator C-terminal domain-containing protein n=1 Tax=Cellulomonas carbonis T26 TaxID=947969 RepID=A0A0A0BU75_9CELL|nr:LytR C-terminal domain-containing protein [Cellulomonas carbonis]KGM10679.1 hypothetical protein N868_14040 [Cellulomonas carbonis T26]GGC07741.1 hypothetical protein GCM10010972_21280 [Cellulomonas carbonis]